MPTACQCLLTVFGNLWLCSSSSQPQRTGPSKGPRAGGDGHNSCEQTIAVATLVQAALFLTPISEIQDLLAGAGWCKFIQRSAGHLDRRAVAQPWTRNSIKLAGMNEPAPNSLSTTFL